MLGVANSNQTDEERIHLIVPDAADEIKFEQIGLGNTARQIRLPSSSSALVSPPESERADGDQQGTPPTEDLADSVGSDKHMTPPLTTATASRRTSQLPPKPSQNGGQGQTPEPKAFDSRRESMVSLNGVILEETSRPLSRGSPAISMTAGSVKGGTPMRKISSNKRRMSSVAAEDPESWALIEQLRAEDMGLRRRGRVAI